MRSSPTLPPLPALRVFETVGRLLSFRQAGEELSITQSAVSHHIKQLEEALGVRLFARKARSVELTGEGRDYLDVTRKALGLIADGTADMRRRATRSVVRVSLLPSFAANWLVSRLAGFRAEHPEIDLELDPTLQLADFDVSADIAIRYGQGPWGEARSELLKAEQLAPVVSPALLRGAPALSMPRDVLNFPLLLTKRDAEWKIWAASVGVDIDQARTIQLMDYNVALQAALDGQGIAIGRMLLVRDHIEAGRLVRPFTQVAMSEWVGHWLVAPKGREISTATRRFVEWIKREIGA